MQSKFCISSSLNRTTLFRLDECTGSQLVLLVHKAGPASKSPQVAQSLVQSRVTAP